jgi:hypothetical protein
VNQSELGDSCAGVHWEWHLKSVQLVQPAVKALSEVDQDQTLTTTHGGLQHDIVGLDVPVDDAMGLEVQDGAEQLAGIPESSFIINRVSR